MTTILHRLVLFLALCLPSALLAQSSQGSGAGGAPPNNSRFVIFIHAGGIPDDVKKSDDEKKPGSAGRISEDERVREIAIALIRKQYTVRVPDRDQDKVGGPGVDYFDDGARLAAEDVANTVNAVLRNLNLLTSEKEKDEKKVLKPRRQYLKSPPNYLGVWLF